MTSTIKCVCPRCQFSYDLQVFKKVKRTLLQNNLYWRWLTIIGEDYGASKEEMHYVFKRQFLADKMPVFSNDEFVKYLRSLNYKEISTTKLNTFEMKEYLDKVNQQAMELGINLPEAESEK